MCVDRSLQCILLCGIVGAIFRPDANQDLSARLDGSGNGICQSVAIARCVQTDGCEVAREALQLVEGSLPVGLGLAGAILVVGTWKKTMSDYTSSRQRDDHMLTDIEPLPIRAGERKGGRSQRSKGREPHIDSKRYYKRSNKD